MHLVHIHSELLTYCIPKCVHFAAVILEINFQFWPICDAHTWVSCLMQEFFNSDPATADKVDLKSENSLKEEKVA